LKFYIIVVILHEWLRSGFKNVSMNKSLFFRKLICLPGILSLVFHLYAENPIISHIFTADPAALVYGDSVYIYTGHDEASPSGSGYVMNDWHVFSSANMINWKDHGEVLALSDFGWASRDAWASHCIERNGKFYWYVTAGPVSGGAFAIGVAVGDSPVGPFTDAIGAPLITDDMTPDLTYDIDPAVFIDDDNKAYLYWGNGGVCKIAMLKDNMIELDGEISNLSLPNFTEAPYLHKRDTIYYLTYAARWPEETHYATGSSPQGPFTYKVMLNDLVSSTTNHQSIIEFKNQWYFIYQTADLPGGGDYRRSVAIDYLFYNPDGTIMQIVQTREGIAHADTTGICPPVPLSPKIQVNGGSWSTNRKSYLTEGDNVILSPESPDSGSWTWNGPDSFTDSIREISLNNLTPDRSGLYMATFTNDCGVKSYMGFNLIVNPPVPENIISGEEYVIKPGNSELVVGVQNGSRSDGANVRQETYTNSTSQFWRLNNVTSVYWRISPVHALSKGLDVKDFSQDDGANVQIWNYWGGTTQQWQIIEQETGVYQLKARHSGKCLEVADTTEGANVRQWTCNGSERQQFLLTLADYTPVMPVK
jgi:hypothetical protein